MLGRDALVIDPVSVDAAAERLRSDAEVDCAIATVIEFAFGRRGESRAERDRIRSALPPRPTVLELVEAVFDHHRRAGPIPEESTRRDDAAMAMAAFLAVDPAALGLPAAMFRVGREIWLTPARRALS